MNILYLCDEYPPGRHGGIGSVVQTTARQLVKMGHRVVVAGFYDWGYGGEDRFTDMGVEVYRFRRRLHAPIFQKQDSLLVRGIYKIFTKSGIWEWDIRRSLAVYQQFLEDIITQHKIDIVEMPDYNDYMRFCKRYTPFPQLSRPTIVKLHGCMTYWAMEEGQQVPDIIRQMERDLINKATAICGVSNYCGTKTAEYLGIAQQIHTIYNGVDLPVTQVVQKVPNKVIFTGTLVKKKGIYQLLKAWNKVHASIPEAELHIYGKGPVDKLKSELSAEAVKTVFFHGHVPKEEIYRSLGSSQVGVFPSFAETFGLAPAECMMCGTATIFTTRTAGPEVVVHNMTGLLADPADADEIYERIYILLSDTALRDKLAEAGRIDSRERFNVAHTAGESLKYYIKTLERSDARYKT